MRLSRASTGGCGRSVSISTGSSRSRKLTATTEVAIVDAAGATALSWVRGSGELQTYSNARLAATGAEPGAEITYGDWVFQLQHERKVVFAASGVTLGSEYEIRVDGQEVARATASDPGGGTPPAFVVEFDPILHPEVPIPAALEATLDVHTVEVYRVDGAGEVLVASGDLTAR